MFCSHCGAKSAEADRFCSNCGKAITVPSADAQNSSSAVHKPSASLFFGTPSTRWWLPFKGKNLFPPGYEWLEQRNTLLVCDNHLVLVQGDEKRSAALDVVETMAMVGAIVGAIRGVKDLFLNMKHELSANHAERLFADRLLVWCNKSDAIIWRYHEKPWMFI